MDAENRDNGNGYRRSWLPTVRMKLLLPVWEGHMVVSGLANLRPNALITGLRAVIDMKAVYTWARQVRNAYWVAN